MAVYTNVPKDALIAFLTEYDIGTLVDYQGVIQGIENTNYIVTTSNGRFILTLFEKRVAESDLPFFFSFMQHLSGRGINAPEIIVDKNGIALKKLCDRSAVIISFLNGQTLNQIDADACNQVGRTMAAMHNFAEDFSATRPNKLSLNGWRELADLCAPRADEVAPSLQSFIEIELNELTRTWPDNLPSGVIHADLFPDNVFFEDGKLSGIIDFYFSCTDAFAYDLAITLNAWAYKEGAAPEQGGWSQENAAAMLKGYQSVRPLSEKEQLALPILLRGAALRILLTRLHDWLHQVEGAQVNVKDPLVYRDLLLFHRGEALTSNVASSKEFDMTEIYTDGACSGNPGPGGWGVLILQNGTEEELCGGDLETTNNRMEMLAAIEGLKATKDEKQIRLYTDSQYLKLSLIHI